MDHKTDVSVIIAMYNSEAWIEDAIQSVVQQDLHGLHMEIIVVDDGSSDRSVDVVKSLNIHNLRLIRLTHNQGQANARNLGVSEAKGDWIQFLDSDDRVSKNLYQEFEKSLQPGKNCYLFSFIRESKVDSVQQTIKSVKDKRAFGHFGGSACNKFIQKNILLPFKPLRYSDIAFSVDMMNVAPLNMALLEGAYYIYNKKSDQSITSNFNLAEFQRMFHYIISQIPGSDRLTRMYILEMSIAFLFDRNIPLPVSLRTAFLSLFKLYRYLPAVIFHQNRKSIQLGKI